MPVHGRREGVGIAGRGTAQLPPYTELLWPTLQSIISLGGSASIEELDRAVITRQGLSPESQRVLHGDGPGTEIEYRLAWARTYLKGMGLLANTSRAVWSVTTRGRDASESDMKPLLATFTAEQRRKRLSRNGGADVVKVLPLVTAESAEPDANRWREAVIDAIGRLPSRGFERFVTTLLRTAGFSTMSVTSSSDERVEGVGVYRLALVSFSVFFQCTRASGRVGADVVREFRASMAGRGEKGLLLSTGSFTDGARKEAHRAGVPVIDLIDGESLCDLLKEHSLGVRTTVRTVEDVVVDPSYFAALVSR